MSTPDLAKMPPSSATLSLGPAGMALEVHGPPRRALGIDPGKITGWGLVELLPRERVLAFGVLDQADPPAHLRELLREHRPELVGVEVVERVHPVVRSGINGISTDQALALYCSGLLAGTLLAEARFANVQRIHVTAERWRSALAGKETASNAAIEQALRLRLAGFPAPRKSNEHERDGIGVALFSLLDWRLRAGARS